MKKLNLKSALSALILVGWLGPSGVLAQDSSCCGDIVNAINTSRDTIVDRLNQGNDYLNRLWNFSNQDLNRRQSTTALINFLAAENFRKYQLDQQLLYQVAPGSDWAISAGVIIGRTPLAASALGINNIGMVRYLGPMTVAQKITVSGVEVNVVDAAKNADPLTWFNKMRDFFVQGDTSNFFLMNPGALLYTDNLKNASISTDQTQELISMLTDPFPLVDENIKTKLRFGGLGLTGKEKERLVDKVAYGVGLGLSTSAFADIVARRTPAQNQDKSVMEIINTYSKQRFTDPEWYKAMGASSSPAMIREGNHMMAFSLYLQGESFKVQEQQLALLASMNAMMAKINVMMNDALKELAVARAQAEAYKAEAERESQRQDSNDEE